MEKYSNIICFGDSYTNEESVYESLGYLDIFKERGYEFKSYPKVLSEYYNAPYETFGAGGMPIHFVIGELIKKMDYILSLKNPLVIFQFGFFCNAIIKYDSDTELIWKDFIPSKIGEETFLAINKRDVISNMSLEDKLSILNWFEKFEDKRNYYYINTFISLCEFLNSKKKIDIFGFLLTESNFDIPNNKFILKFNKSGFYEKFERINEVFPDLIDTHKSTQANIDLAHSIIDKFKIK